MPSKEIQYAINLLENEAEDLKSVLQNGMLLKDIRDQLQEEYLLALRAIKQLRDL